MLGSSKGSDDSSKLNEFYESSGYRTMPQFFSLKWTLLSAFISIGLSL